MKASNVAQLAKPIAKPDGKPDILPDLSRAIADSTMAQEQIAKANAEATQRLGLAMLNAIQNIRPAKDTVVVEAKKVLHWEFTCEYDNKDRITNIIAKAKG